MARKAILQIGTEKTGTTTLQHFLALNRERLEARGWRYPRFCGEHNHTGLAAYALDPAKSDPIREPFGARSPEDVPPTRARLRQAARVELSGRFNVIFCSEHCHSRLTTPAEVETLRAFLAEFFDDVQVCVYLRRQDQVALSLYSTRLKSGDTAEAILPQDGGLNLYYDYDRFLALWEEAFGPERVHVRLFDRAAMTGGSVVPDFLACWDLGAPEDYTPVADRNTSIRPVAQEFLRRVNLRLQAIGGHAAETARGPLAARLEQAFAGHGARPARAAAQAFFEHHRASNEAVRRRHFPERAVLFNEDFSAYPETEDSRALTLDDFAAVAAELHLAVQDDIFRLEAEVALREARLSWTRGQRLTAIAALRRALNWRPNHAEAHRTLGEYLLREDRLPEATVTARAAVEHRPLSAEYWHFLGNGSAQDRQS